MIRTLAISAIAACGLALPALADTGPSSDARASAALSTVLDNAWMGREIRLQLMHNGVTHVSTLERDSSGRFVGTAIKNGKNVIVAVIFPVNPEASAAID